MIDIAISHIAGQLNQSLKRTFDLSEDIVIVSDMARKNGASTSSIDDKLAIFLVNIEKDTVPQPVGVEIEGSLDRSVVTYPPVYLNLYVMVAGYFSDNNYLEALKFLSHAISFFQRNPCFNRNNSPDLDPKIDKLLMEIENMDQRDLSVLWGALNDRYLPSVLYKVMMVAFDSDDIMLQVPTVIAPETSIRG